VRCSGKGKGKRKGKRKGKGKENGKSEGKEERKRKGNGKGKRKEKGKGKGNKIIMRRRLYRFSSFGANAWIKLEITDLANYIMRDFLHYVTDSREIYVGN
jgi:hypothetical protein